MLHDDPSKRPSIDDILGSEWMLGEQPSKQELAREMQERFELLEPRVPAIDDVSIYLDPPKIEEKEEAPPTSS